MQSGSNHGILSRFPQGPPLKGIPPPLFDDDDDDDDDLDWFSWQFLEILVKF